MNDICFPSCKKKNKIGIIRKLQIVNAKLVFLLAELCLLLNARNSGKTKTNIISTPTAINNIWSSFSLDINCGCPVPKVVKDGSGSGLLQRLDRMQDVLNVPIDLISTGPDRDHTIILTPPYD